MEANSALGNLQCSSNFFLSSPNWCTPVQEFPRLRDDQKKQKKNPKTNQKKKKTDPELEFKFHSKSIQTYVCASTCCTCSSICGSGLIPNYLKKLGVDVAIKPAPQAAFCICTIIYLTKEIPIDGKWCVTVSHQGGDGNKLNDFIEFYQRFLWQRWGR